MRAAIKLFIPALTTYSLLVAVEVVYSEGMILLNKLLGIQVSEAEEADTLKHSSARK